MVVDLETGGFNAQTDAILEIGAVIMQFDEKGRCAPESKSSITLTPFLARTLSRRPLNSRELRSTTLRGAIGEGEALRDVFGIVRRELKRTGCHRAVLVGHNASFDLGFLNAAVERNKIKRNPFHPFSSFDTATLAGVAFGQTVLARACEAAGIAFDAAEAHSALYDCEKTAQLFADVVNRWPFPKNLISAEG